MSYKTDLQFCVQKHKTFAHQRIRQNIWSRDGFESEKIYEGGIYELETINSKTRALHYIYGPSGLVAIKKQEMEGNTTSLQLVINDHLGSIQLLTDEQGNLIEEYSYDAWGMRRDPITLDVYDWAEMPVTGMDYGFTGHEHLDIFMLVNMNGRMYDPVIGRFLTPDPVLQFPNYTQGLNPYAYALNNPLRFVDPDGYSLVGQLIAVGAQIAFSAVGLPVLGLVAYSVIMTVDYAIEQGRNVKAGEIYGYFVQTFVMSAISMGATKGIGAYFDQFKATGLRELGRAVAHGTFNGAMRYAQGGKFEHGFLSGFVSSLGGSFMQSNDGNMSLGAKVTMSAVIGGTAEKLGGGKFANGAVTGAYVMMFNHLQEVKTSKITDGKYDWNELNADQRAQVIFDNIRQKNIEAVGTDEVILSDFFYNLPKVRIDIHDATVSIGGHDVKVWIDGNPFMKLGGPTDKIIHQKLYHTKIETWYRIKYGVGFWVTTPYSQINKSLIWRYLDGHPLKSDILLNP